MDFLIIWAIGAAALNIAAFAVDTIVDLASDEPFIKIPVWKELLFNSLFALVYPLVWLAGRDIFASDMIEEIMSVAGFICLVFLYWFIHNKIHRDNDIEFNWRLTVVMIWIANILIMLVGAHFEVFD